MERHAEPAGAGDHHQQQQQQQEQVGWQGESAGAAQMADMAASMMCLAKCDGHLHSRLVIANMCFSMHNSRALQLQCAWPGCTTAAALRQLR
jgi:hypothetical protein